jgi:uncharacterized membrane protein YfcA
MDNLLTNIFPMWSLAIAASCGSVLAGPMAAFTVSKISSSKLKVLIGVITIVLGVVTLVKVL